MHCHAPTVRRRLPRRWGTTISNAFSGALSTIPSEVRVKRSHVPVDCWVEAALVAGCMFWMGMREGLFLLSCGACGQLGVRPD